MSGISKIVTTMKKIMKPFVLVAATAMALASCQKNEIPAPEKQDVHFTINAGIETKTSIVESEDKDENGKPIYHAQWDGNEELGVLFAAPDAETKDTDVVRLKNAESGSLASFEGTVTVDEPAGTFYAFYPAAAFNRGYEEGDARLDLKNVQKPTATSFDPLCDILVAKPYNYEVVEGKVVADGLEFARLMSVLRIDLKSEFADIQNEFVESVSFTAGDVEITGYARIFLDNPKFDKWASNGAQWCTVTANYDSDLVSINGTSNSVYLVIAPVTIPANKDLTFEIKTKNYNISKTIKSPEMKFTAGKVSKINLTIAADNCDKIDTSIDYSGEYLIVGDNSGAKYAAVKYDGTSNNLKGIALTMEDDKILEFDTMADSKMVVTKVADGTYAGLYTIQDASGKYLYAASSSANNLKSSAISNTTPEHYYWSITERDGVYEIIASKSGNRNVMQFNYNNGSPIFNCYSSASQKAVALYAYSDIKPDTTPKIFVTNTNYSVKATDTSVEIPYTVKNITGTISATVADDATMTNANASVVGNNVKVTFDANEAAESKTATIVLSYEGAESVNVVLTQAGTVAENVPVQKSVTYTVASTSSVTVSGDAPAGASATYASTYNTKCQLTSGNSMTFTLSGYNGCTINGVTLSMKSNSSKGAGSLSIKAGNKDVGMISAAKFNTSSWYGAWSTSYVDVKPTITSTVVGSGEDIVITISATENSLYCQSVKIEYTTSGVSGDGGGETTDPDPTPDPEPSVKTYTLTIDASSFNTTSYAANNNEKTSTAIATDGTTMDVKWTSYQVMKQSNAMQWQKNAGYIYNSTDLGTITNIAITNSAGTFTKYINTNQKPTSNGSGGYFQIKVGSATGSTSKIVITFTK